MNEKLSVVIPLYNKERTIARAIDSVRAQSVDDWRLFVVDDGSTDAGPEIVERYEESRIHLIRQENGGVSAARNAGIKAAGEGLVAFLDADDFWDSDMLEELLALRAKFPGAGLYATGYRKIDDGGKGYSVSASSRAGGRHHQVDNYLELSCSFNVVHTSSVAVPADVLTAVGGFPLGEKFGEDIAVWGKISLRYAVACSSAVCGNFTADVQNTAPRHREGVLRSPLVDVLAEARRNGDHHRVSEKVIIRKIRSLIWDGVSYHARSGGISRIPQWLKETSGDVYTPLVSWLSSRRSGRNLVVIGTKIRRFRKPVWWLKLFRQFDWSGLTFTRLD